MDKDLRQVLLFDTSIMSENLGDQIVMQYCEKNLRKVFPKDFFIHTATHDRIGKRTHLYNAKIVDYSIVCGTNILKGNINKKPHQWSIRLIDGIRLKNLCLMGVGWWQYNNEANCYTKYIYKNMLSPNLLHSVRDEYTKNRLNEIGISNVVNTGCPTMWGFTTELCASIPNGKSRNVVTTVTNYNNHNENDRKMLNILLRNYQTVYVWIQSCYDYQYVKTLTDSNRISFIDPTLQAYEDFLAREEVDYVGTRLHAGIKAINMQKRAIILAVDNRAIEIGRDTGLCVIKREQAEEKLESMVNTTFETKLDINFDAIQQWLKQFER